ncbi:MAG: reductive dehalogenase [Anaerolineales bacterium]|nr:reductive dehalogenase [Chloroflexota bacterium]MBL6980506.1 reductive dehalogenase [Anaerolineales bacterium]
MEDKGNKSLSRRDFLRIAGLSASSIAAGKLSSNSSPMTSVEVAKSHTAGNLRPWWVQTVDEPTTEINWDGMQRYDARMTARGQGFANYIGQAEADRLTEIANQVKKQRLDNNVPGYTLKDQAINAAQSAYTFGSRSFLGPQNVETPMERGVPSWTGTAEEAAQILRAAMRHFGAATVGFVELNKNTRKLIYSYDPDGKEIVFENVDEAYETDGKRVIPDKAKWVIVYTVQMSSESLKRAPTVIAEQTTRLAYGRALDIQIKTQEFIRGLGYQCLGEASSNSLGISPAFAVMVGLGELARHNRLITPEFGPMVRVFKMITDLRVQPDKPIDAGIMKFCKHCKKCAEACPASALSFDDEPSWDIQGDWNNSGHKAYFEDSIKCKTFQRENAATNCGICFAVCPFAKKNKVWIHDWVKTGIATFPFLDGVIRSMDDAFSYGAQKDPEKWWQLDLPEYGIDTEQTTNDE